MARKAVKLTNALGKDVLSESMECVLKFSPEKEGNARKIFKKFIKKNGRNGILLFAHQSKDKLGHLLAFKQECEKAGVKLTISLYCECEDKDPNNEGPATYWDFREVDIKLDDDLNEMIIW